MDVDAQAAMHMEKIPTHTDFTPASEITSVGTRMLLREVPRY